jgi:hypothetical protein
LSAFDSSPGAVFLTVLTWTAIETSELANVHAIENAKTFEEVMDEARQADVDKYMDPTAPKAPDFDTGDVLGQGQPGRIFRSTLSHPYDVKRPPE